MRGNCKACGATVDFAIDEDNGKPIALEVHPESAAEAPRYRVVATNPLIVRRVPTVAMGAFYPDHKFDCPGGNAGR